MRRVVCWIGAVVVGVGMFGCASSEAPKLASYADPPRVVDTKGVAVVGKYRSEWRAFLGEQRRLQISRLRDYAAREQYAQNDQDGLRFVWRDSAGRLCAMANLVNESGRADLVEKVATESNDLQLATVDDGELHEWMLTSGLLQEEVQLVQEPDFTSRRPQIEPVEPVAQDPFGDPQRQAWQVRRKHSHLDLAIERLEMDSADSIEAALDRLGARLDELPS